MSLIHSTLQRRFIPFMSEAVTQPISSFTAYSFDPVPADEEITKYRRSWNPFSERRLLIQSVDIHPADQLSVGPFLITQFSKKNYGNSLTFPSNANNGPVHTYVVSPPVTSTYDLTSHAEIGAATSTNGFWSRGTTSAKGGVGPWIIDAGMGDPSLAMKYRPVVQDPYSARPSITLYHQIVLANSRWTGTVRPPGSFALLGRLPSIRFGELGVTEAVVFQQNDNSFRTNGGVYSPHSAPSGNNRVTTCIEDAINTRLMFEHSFDDKQDLAYNLDPTTILTAADGQTVMRSTMEPSTTPPSSGSNRQFTSDVPTRLSVLSVSCVQSPVNMRPIRSIPIFRSSGTGTRPVKPS